MSATLAELRIREEATIQLIELPLRLLPTPAGKQQLHSGGNGAPAGSASSGAASGLTASSSSSGGASPASSGSSVIATAVGEKPSSERMAAAAVFEIGYSLGLEQSSPDWRSERSLCEFVKPDMVLNGLAPGGGAARLPPAYSSASSDAAGSGGLDFVAARHEWYDELLSLLDEGSALAPGTKQVVWEIVQLLPTDAHTLGRIACLEDGSDNNWGALLQMRAG